MTIAPYRLDFAHYPDTGCQVHPACLSCPLPRCVLDEPPGQRAAARNRERDAAIIAAMQRGESVRQIGATLGISRRTVHRVINQNRIAERDAVSA